MTQRFSKTNARASLRSAAGLGLAWMLSVLAAGSAMGSLKLITDLTGEDQTLTALPDPFASGSANNPGKISFVPPEGDGIKKFASPDEQNELFRAADAGPFHPINFNDYVMGIGRYSMNADGSAAGNSPTVGLSYVPPAPVPSPGAIVTLVAAGVLGGRRRR